MCTYKLIHDDRYGIYQWDTQFTCQLHDQYSTKCANFLWHAVIRKNGSSLFFVQTQHNILWKVLNQPTPRIWKEKWSCKWIFQSQNVCFYKLIHDGRCWIFHWDTNWNCQLLSWSPTECTIFLWHAVVCTQYKSLFGVQTKQNMIWIVCSEYTPGPGN